MFQRWMRDERAISLTSSTQPLDQSFIAEKLRKKYLINHGESALYLLLSCTLYDCFSKQIDGAKLVALSPDIPSATVPRSSNS